MFCVILRHHPKGDSCSKNRTKRLRKGTFAHWAGTCIISCPWTSALLVLRPLDFDEDFHHGFSWFSGLLTQTSYTTGFPASPAGRSWGFLASIITWANSRNKPLCICLCVCVCVFVLCWLCFSRWSWLIQMEEIISSYLTVNSVSLFWPWLLLSVLKTFIVFDTLWL